MSFYSLSINKINTFVSRSNDFVFLVLRNNIFFHSSAISYYTALAIAPFLLILLQIAAFIGPELQEQLIVQTYYVLGPEVGTLTEMVFNNAKEGIDLASISGLIGGSILLFTASVVFLQLRFSLDTIYGYHDPDISRSFVKERLFSMGVVIVIALLFFLSLFVSNLIKFIAGSGASEGFWAFIISNIISFIINLIMFTALYYFAPTRRPKPSSAFKVAIFTSIAFFFGKIVMGLYFKNVAINSVYGATGTLLVFLVWAYYSSFFLFLSLEGFLFMHPEEKLMMQNHKAYTVIKSL
jgi:membrane protein